MAGGLAWLVGETRRWRRVALLGYFAAVSPMFLGHSVALANDNPPVAPINDAGDPPFPVQLQALVNFYGFHETNYLCVVAYKSAPDQPDVFWPTQDIFIDTGDGGDNILTTTVFWDIRKETAPVGGVADAGLIRKGLVDQEVRGCFAHGKTYVLRKTVAGWVPISKYRQFATVKTQLQTIVDHDGSRKTNRFCVIGQKDGVYLAAYVIWKTNDMLYFWLPTDSDVDDPYAVESGTGEIDLKYDLRDTSAADTRYQMQRSYAERVLQACDRSGEMFTIFKSN